MSTSRNIKASSAYIKLTTRDSRLVKGLRRAQARQCSAHGWHGQGGWLTGYGRLTRMVAQDGPTLEYYLGLEDKQ